MDERDPSESASPAQPPDDLLGVSFETALERLEAIVDHLEQRELALEDALASFEEGVALTRHCATQLESAERRIEILIREGDSWVARPFDDPEDED